MIIQVVIDAHFRWSYSHKMIKRFLLLEEPMRALPVPTGLSPVDRALLRELEAVLGAVTEQLFGLEGDTYVTLSLVLPKV